MSDRWYRFSTHGAHAVPHCLLLLSLSVQNCSKCLTSSPILTLWGGCSCQHCLHWRNGSILVSGSDRCSQLIHERTGASYSEWSYLWTTGYGTAWSLRLRVKTLGCPLASWLDLQSCCFGSWFQIGMFWTPLFTYCLMNCVWTEDEWVLTQRRPHLATCFEGTVSQSCLWTLLEAHFLPRASHPLYPGARLLSEEQSSLDSQ